MSVGKGAEPNTGAGDGPAGGPTLDRKDSWKKDSEVLLEVQLPDELTQLELHRVTCFKCPPKED